jgi:molybdopterin molybdotransferase
MLTYAQAKVTILQQALSLTSEVIPFEQAIGRTLAEPLTASTDLPRFDNSAVDGYAVRTADIAEASANTAVTLPCTAYIHAGRADLPPLEPQTCQQIATGAPLPHGADAVVMREQVQRDGDQVRFTRPTTLGNNIRRRAKDLSAGTALFATGTTLAPTHLGLLAAQGLTKLKVVRPLRVNVLSTGSELVEPTQAPGPGQIRESNSYLLQGLLQSEACVVQRLHKVVDDLSSTVDTLRAALQADVLLISGGVSVGDSDFVKPAMRELGVEEIFWRVGIKPGKPLFFARHHQTLIFGLPGNPASTFVLFEELVRPFLRKCLGHNALEPPLRRARLTCAHEETSERVQLLRARWFYEHATDWIEPMPEQGSFSIASISGANALIHLPEHSLPHRAGDEVTFRPLAHRFTLLAS